MSHFDHVTIFTARLAPGFESENLKLYEVVTPDGERIASACNETQCKDLASELSGVLRRWANRVGFDAVLG